MSDDFDPEVLRELEENFRMINATAGALSGTLDKLNIAGGGQSQAQKAENEARQKNTGSINAGTRIQEASAKATAELVERTQNFSNATKSSTDALVSMTTAMIDGKGKFSDFNDGLGSAGDAAFSLGKNFGPIGMILGGLVKGATMAAQEMTRLSDAQVTLTKDLRKMGGISGASSDELFRLGNEAGITAENFGNITRMAQDASSALTSLGGTAGEGQRQMLEMFKVDKKTRMAFARTGIDLEDLQEGMKDYLKLQEASGFQLGRSDKTSKQIQKSSMDYVSNLQVLSDLTGKRISELKEEQQRVASQLREQLEVRRVEIEISNLKKKAANEKDPVEKARLENLAKGMQQEQDMRQQFMADATGSLGAETAIQLSKVMRTGAFDKDSIGLSQVGVNPNELKARFAGMDEGSEEYKDEFAKFLGEFKEGQDKQIERIGTGAQFAEETQLKRLVAAPDEASLRLQSKIGGTGEGEGSEVARQRAVRDAQEGRKGGGEAGEKLIGSQVLLQETQRDLATSAERVIQGLNPLTGEMNAAKVAMVALTASAGLASLSLGAMSLGGPLGKATTGLTGMFKGLGKPLTTLGTKTASVAKSLTNWESTAKAAKGLGSSMKSATGHLSKIGPALKDIGPQLTKLGPQVGKATMEAGKTAMAATQKGLQTALGTATANMGKMLGGAGLGALTAGIFEVFEYQKDAAKIDEDLKKGLLTNAEADEAKQNEMGEGIGSTAGAAIGAAIGVLGGPLGMAIGGYIGAELGGWIGKKVTEDDKPEANREDLNAARKLDVYDEDSFGNSEIDFARLEETMLSGQLKPEMLEAMFLDDDLGEEDQAKLVGIMDEFREAGQVFEMDKTAKEREETLAKEKLERDEKELADKKKRSDAMAALVDKEIDESKATAGTKAELAAAELAQKELGLKGQEEINSRLRVLDGDFGESTLLATKAITDSGEAIGKDVTEAGGKVAEGGPSFMSSLFDGLLSAIPGGNLLKKGMDFFKGKDEVEEETQLAEAKPEVAGAVDPDDFTEQGMQDSFMASQFADFESASQFAGEDQLKQLLGGADSIEEFESGPGMFASLMGKVKDMTGSLLGDGKSPEEKIYDTSMADGSTTLLNDYSEKSPARRTRETSTTTIGGNSEAYRMLAGEASGQIETPPDAKTLLAKDAVEESKEKGTSTTDIIETKDSTTEMLETLRLIAQNGAEQNAKLSAIADASEAGVTVNKKILSTASV